MIPRVLLMYILYILLLLLLLLFCFGGGEKFLGNPKCYEFGFDDKRYRYPVCLKHLFFTMVRRVPNLILIIRCIDKAILIHFVDVFFDERRTGGGLGIHVSRWLLSVRHCVVSRYRWSEWSTPRF